MRWNNNSAYSVHMQRASPSHEVERQLIDPFRDAMLALPPPLPPFCTCLWRLQSARTWRILLPALSFLSLRLLSVPILRSTSAAIASAISAVDFCFSSSASHPNSRCTATPIGAA